MQYFNASLFKWHLGKDSFTNLHANKYFRPPHYHFPWHNSNNEYANQEHLKAELQSTQLKKCNHNCCILYFSFFSFIRSPLPSSCWSQWKKVEFTVACRHLKVLERRHVSFYSFPILLPSQEEEDTFRRYQKAKGWAVLPELILLLPHEGRQTKRKAGHQAHLLQGKCGQAHEDLRAMGSLSKPRKQQNLFSFHWKYRNRMGFSFPSLHRAPMLPVSQVMQFFRQVATAGGLSNTKWNSKLCFQM